MLEIIKTIEPNLKGSRQKLLDILTFKGIENLGLNPDMNF